LGNKLQELILIPIRKIYLLLKFTFLYIVTTIKTEVHLTQACIILADFGNPL
jgi:hypothetical protein